MATSLRPKDERRRNRLANEAKDRRSRMAHATEARRRLERLGRAWVNGREVGGADGRYAHLAHSYD
jgi:hypothetical protein